MSHQWYPLRHQTLLHLHLVRVLRDCLLCPMFMNTNTLKTLKKNSSWNRTELLNRKEQFNHSITTQTREIKINSRSHSNLNRCSKEYLYTMLQTQANSKVHQRCVITHLKHFLSRPPHQWARERRSQVTTLTRTKINRTTIHSNRGWCNREIMHRRLVVQGCRDQSQSPRLSQSVWLIPTTTMPLMLTVKMRISR